MARMPIEHGKVREYALATDNFASTYLDDIDAVIPPTFLSTVVFWESLTSVFDFPETVAALRDAGINADVRRLLSLEQEYIYHTELPRAGQVCYTSIRFDRIEEKMSSAGRMIMVHFVVEFRSEDTVDGVSRLRAECRYTSGFMADVQAGDPPAGKLGARRDRA